MKQNFRKWLVLAALLACGAVLAQRGGRAGGQGGGGGFRGGGFRGGAGEGYVPDGAQTPRDVPSHSTGTPTWTNAIHFEKDAFTFVRIKYHSGGYRRGGWGWKTDTPDSDLNLSYRLQEKTSIKVDPNGRYVDLTDKELFDYPWIYMVEPGQLHFEDNEVPILRRYLLNGGFLMVDDFWGEGEWASFEAEMKRVLPEKTFSELPLDSPLYHSVFPITEKLQVPGLRVWESRHVTWEREDAHVVHHRVIMDEKGRIMVIATHNMDNGDGWEREGEDEEFFHKFSEKVSYPLGINIIVYSMTH